MPQFQTNLDCEASCNYVHDIITIMELRQLRHGMGKGRTNYMPVDSHRPFAIV